MLRLFLLGIGVIFCILKAAKVVDWGMGIILAPFIIYGVLYLIAIVIIDSVPDKKPPWRK